MTVAGIEVRRDDTGLVPAGSLILTTNRRNPVVVASGSVLIAASGATYYGTLITITETCPQDSILAIKQPQSCVMYTASYSGTAWTWELIPAGSVGDTVEYFVFAEKDLTGGSPGIEIYDDSGQLQFAMHPGDKPMRVVEALNGSYGLSGTVVAYPAGPDYAIAYGKHSGRLIWEANAKPSTFALPDPDYYIQLWHGLFAGIDSGTDFNIGDQRLDPPPETFVGTNAPDYSLERDWTDLGHLVLDVTDY